VDGGGDAGNSEHPDELHGEQYLANLDAVNLQFELATFRRSDQLGGTARKNLR
jgi:hypothetical protein